MRGLGKLVVFAVVVNAAFIGTMVALRKAMPSIGDEDSDEIALTSIMEGRTLKSRAGAFRGGSAVTAASGLVLDLRGATLAPGGAFLELRTFAGGTAVAVPEDWPVEVRGQGIFGQVSNRVDEKPAEGQDRLTVDALAVMGSIDIGHKPLFLVEPDDGTDGMGEIAVAPTVV